MTAKQYKNEMLLNAFVNGVKSNSIRQRILETMHVSVDLAFATVKSLELAHDNSCKYKSNRGGA